LTRNPVKTKKEDAQNFVYSVNGGFLDKWDATLYTDEIGQKRFHFRRPHIARVLLVIKIQKTSNPARV
jgi:hypothetical protein